MHLILRKKTITINKATFAAWVQEVNRGELTMITDQAQDAFMSIEANIKSKLRVNKTHKMD